MQGVVARINLSPLFWQFMALVRPDDVGVLKRVALRSGAPIAMDHSTIGEGRSGFCWRLPRVPVSHLEFSVFFASHQYALRNDIVSVLRRVANCEKRKSHERVAKFRGEENLLPRMGNR
jgi:hypothetical protein